MPFGDVHMAWTPEGLYLFCLAKSYYDPNILACGKKFPLSEAFQLHLNVMAANTSHHYGLSGAQEKHVVPQ